MHSDRNLDSGFLFNRIIFPSYVTVKITEWIVIYSFDGEINILNQDLTKQIIPNNQSFFYVFVTIIRKTYEKEKEKDIS